LASTLGKQLPPGDDYAESWELVDHGLDQSVVEAGPLSGTSLHNIVVELGPALLGQHAPQPHFPLLFKFLDAQNHLSVQVHPNDQQAAQLDPPDRGKTEAWIVMHAEPGSRIYAGLRPGVTRDVLEEAISAGTAADCLHCVEPSAGDCLFIPAGTVHAIGAGLVIAEIQQSSDTTYRLFDWNRVGPDGQPRQLHVQQSLEVIDFDRGPVDPQQEQPSGRGFVHRLIACEKFVVDRWRISSPKSVGGDNRCHLIVPLEGALCVERDASATPLTPGQTVLLPAAAGTLRIEPREPCVLLDIYLPLTGD
jgi:mannose-6-phosphate isomerase